MYRCLTVDEILSQIVLNLAPRQPEAPSECDIEALTAVALTCKTFYEPAMAVSWASLEGLGRLMCTLPDRVFVEHPPACSTPGVPVSDSIEVHTRAGRVAYVG